MFEFLFGWTVEVQRWGWNLITFSCLATICVTILQGSMTLQQGLKILRMRHAQSVSVAFFGFRLWTFASIFIYAFYAKSLALLVNGFVQTLVQAYVMAQLIRFKRDASRFDWSITVWSVGLVPLTFLTNGHPSFIAAIAVISLFPIVLQNKELLLTRRTGSLSGPLILALNASSFFWTVYGFVVRDLAIMLFAPVASLLYALLGIQFLLYRNNERTDST